MGRKRDREQKRKQLRKMEKWSGGFVEYTETNTMPLAYKQSFALLLMVLNVIMTGIVMLYGRSGGIDHPAMRARFAPQSESFCAVSYLKIEACF